MPKSPDALLHSANVAFDQPIPQTSINLDGKQRSNPLPWRGQFSPELVEAILSAYYPGSGAILDPFVGSGTVLHEAARLGVSATGVEVNPAAYFLSSIYTFVNLDGDCRRQIINEAERRLFDSASTSQESAPYQVELLPPSAEPLARSAPCPHSAYVGTLTLVLTLLSQQSKDLWKRWRGLRQLIFSLPYSPSPVSLHLADARALPLKSSSIKFVLTSPPYINVINYHQQYRQEMENKGWDVLRVSKSEIGSNRKFRQNRFLTVVQYVMDMGLVLREIARVSANDARIVFVVGKVSTVLGTSFFNAEIIKALAVALGFTVHLTQTRVFLNRYGKKIYEEILNLSPPEQLGAISTPLVLEKARSVSLNTLLSALDRVPGKNSDLLLSALEKIDAVKPSPLLNPKLVAPSIKPQNQTSALS